MECVLAVLADMTLTQALRIETLSRHYFPFPLRCQRHARIVSLLVHAAWQELTDHATGSLLTRFSRITWHDVDGDGSGEQRQDGVQLPRWRRHETLLLSAKPLRRPASCETCCAPSATQRVSLWSSQQLATRRMRIMSSAERTRVARSETMAQEASAPYRTWGARVWVYFIGQRHCWR